MTWLLLALLVAFVAAGLLGMVLWYAASVPSSQLFGPALVRGPAEGRRVTLTFDDGPASPFTGQILDILRERRVLATFFVCGRNAERHPEIVRRIAAEGHTIGNHTYSHPFLYLLTPREMAEEIDRTQQVIERVTGRRPTLFRPPYGARWFGLYSVLRERGLRLVQWSDTGYDWKYDAAAMVRVTVAGLAPGSIILLHDTLEGTEGFLAQAARRFSGRYQGRQQAPPSLAGKRSQTVAALPEIIDGARQAGLEFVSIQEFLPR